MSKTLVRTAEPATMTVGDLIGELCRWPDHATVTFRCPYLKQALHFDHLESGVKGVVEIQLTQHAESPPVDPA